VPSVELELKGRRALVAGGGRGLGRAIAEALAREGVHVAVWARTEAEVRETAKVCAASAVQAVPVVGDLARVEERERGFSTVLEKLGPPEILVLAAAGFYAPMKLHAESWELVRGSLELDLLASVDLCRRALPGMLDARYGRVLAVSSLAARTGVAGATAYATAKDGLEGMIRGVALDYSRRNITANALAVGFADTERVQKRIGTDASWRERLERSTATRKLLRPEEVADVALFLASPRASGITGSVVDVTGGAHLNTQW